MCQTTGYTDLADRPARPERINWPEPSPEPPAEIPTELATQHDALEFLNSRIDFLERRLELVLRPSAEPRKDATRPGTGVVIVDMLSTSNDRLRDASSRLTEIIARLAL